MHTTSALPNVLCEVALKILLMVLPQQEHQNCPLRLRLYLPEYLEIAVDALFRRSEP
jgi:hypothetical protein